MRIQRKGELFRLAAASGMLTGLISGPAWLFLQSKNWISGPRAHITIWYENFWISPLFNLLLFLLVAFVLWLAGRIVPILASAQVSMSIFGFLLFLNWVDLSGRMRFSAALILSLGLSIGLARFLSKREERVHATVHRTVLPLAAATALAFLGVEGEKWFSERTAMNRLPQAGRGVPNVLIIVLDTLRADHLSSYGYSRSTSPNIDRLASEGALFENAYATSSWTLPAHASMLTGLYPFEHGTVLRGQRLSNRFVTLGEELQKLGYRTRAISANPYFFIRRDGFANGFMHFDDLYHSWASYAVRTYYGHKIYQFLFARRGHEDYPARRRAVDVTRASVEWIERDPQIPFFLFLNYYDVHEPYLSEPGWRNRFSSKPKPGGIFNSPKGRFDPQLTPEQLQDEIDAYDGAIAYADHHIGELLKNLERLGMAEKTLVIITSDHGEGFGEHGLIGHRKALYHHLVRVPYIFWMPGRIAAGRRVSVAVTNTSLPATVIEIVALGARSPFHEPSVAGWWPGNTPPGHGQSVLCELSKDLFTRTARFPADFGDLKSLINEQWQYITQENGGQQLYDLRKDPGQTQNVIDSPEGRIVAAKFAAELNARLTRQSAGAAAQAGKAK
jgi:arylsulfatase A-like enzyme